MKRQQLPTYLLALAVLIVGLAAIGMPVTSLIVPLVLLACPLMMIFMMRGMHGHRAPEPSEQQHDEHASPGRR